MPCWLCKILKWSWTFPWAWFLFKAVSLWPDDGVRTLGDMANRASGFLGILADFLIAAGVSFVLRKLWERKRLCDC